MAADLVEDFNIEQFSFVSIGARRETRKIVQIVWIIRTQLSGRQLLFFSSSLFRFTRRYFELSTFGINRSTVIDVFNASHTTKVFSRCKVKVRRRSFFF